MLRVRSGISSSQTLVCFGLHKHLLRVKIWKCWITLISRTPPSLAFTAIPSSYHWLHPSQPPPIHQVKCQTSPTFSPALECICCAQNLCTCTLEYATAVSYLFPSKLYCQLTSTAKQPKIFTIITSSMHPFTNVSFTFQICLSLHLLLHLLPLSDIHQHGSSTNIHCKHHTSVIHAPITQASNSATSSVSVRTWYSCRSVHYLYATETMSLCYSYHAYMLQTKIIFICTDSYHDADTLMQNSYVWWVCHLNMYIDANQNICLPRCRQLL
jgi:hypothetical protein